MPPAWGDGLQEFAQHTKDQEASNPPHASRVGDAGRTRRLKGSSVAPHDGVLPRPNCDVAATGRAVALPWAAVYVTDGDALKSEHLFFDQMDFLGQLGLLPG